MKSLGNPYVHNQVKNCGLSRFYFEPISTLLIVIVIGCSCSLGAQATKVSSFGYDAEDATSAIYKAMLSLHDTLIIDRQEGPWIIGPMTFKGVSNKTILIEKGVELHAKKNAFPRTSDALLEFSDCSNIKLLGEGTKLCMNKSEYTDGEWRHGISLRKCKDITLKNLEIHDSGGDGIYISGSKKGEFSENILISNLVSSNNKRQGISIISAQNVQIEHSIFQNTVGTLPGAGADLEPNTKYDRLENIVFSNCMFQNNDHSGIVLALSKMEADSRPVDIRFVDCTIQNNHNENNKYVAGEITLSAHKTNPVRGAVLFENCTIQKSKWGLLYSRKTNNAYHVTFKNCSAIDICQDGSFPPIYLEVPDYYQGDFSLGGFTFDNVFIKYSTDVPLILVRGSSLNTLNHLSDITGQITVEGNTGKKIEYIKYDSDDDQNVSLSILYKKLAVD